MAATSSLSRLPLAVLLALSPFLHPGPATAQDAVPASPETIAAQELFWSYGRSPPVYPSPSATGLDDWAPAYAYATHLVGQMTNAEKQNLSYGFSTTANGCSGTSGAAPRVGFPGLCLNDGPAGVRATELVNGYASGVAVGASWNRELARERGLAIGREARAKGVNVWLGPVMGPLGRTVLGGRNWEGFSVDPYLSGVLSADTVAGVQENVAVSAKHFVGNEQETNRNPVTATGNASVSSNIDDRTMHELYLWPFQDVVRAGAGTVMCSYNRINNSYGCQNSKTLNGLLKGELGFQGFVVSDWGAQHTGVASAEAGLDMAMPDSEYWDGNLTVAVENGTLAQSRLDDMAKRIVATWYKLARFEPGTGMPYSLEEPHDDQKVTALSPASRDAIYRGAVEGHVLVKNVNNALPLKNPQIVSLFGYDAPAPAADSDLAPSYFSALSDADVPQAAYNGTLISGGGSGAITPSYLISPHEAFSQRARASDTQLLWDFRSPRPSVNAASDACLVLINAFATEGFDRTRLTDPSSDTLVASVAANCSNTIVVIHNAGIRLVDAWIAHPNVTAAIFAHLPGPDSGRALAALVYGDAVPSGKLPYTVAKAASDYGDRLYGPVRPDAASDYYTQADFAEGVYLDYRRFERDGDASLTPRFPFGFGLSYTTFSYTNLSASLLPSNSSSPPPPRTAPLGAGITQGGLASLWTPLATVSASITNAGAEYAGAEVVQLYVGIPADGVQPGANGTGAAAAAPPSPPPAKQLRGFAKVALAPGESAAVSFELTRRDLSVWDVESQGWVLPRGEYGVYVAASVEDVRLAGGFVVGG
ncbi:glycoside hydrolase family 3 protein [Diplodia corticola]|uniref:beta-glucosidase n=1 Tax=Diplodia corticola TaxID=236234 RepID=A0A1J9QUD6_9PEZI|nr:glycoside hydrolase family 3 protein [Diplodia corticola]OJD32056.1 glycoside hydrolase family 3 protein [Diplodia corticola]